MTDPEPDAASESRVIQAADPRTAGSDRGGAEPARRPYLRVLGPETGVFELDLPERTFTIGRSDGTDLTLPDPRTSRVHATISFHDGRYTFEDSGSTHGSTVNGKRIERRVLEHGDSIVIAMYQLEFRTHAELPGAGAAAARARLLLGRDFCVLPANVPFKFRTLALDPQDVFESGDTLELGCGGVLIPSANPPSKWVCLELQVSWPNQTSTRYLGEILGTVQEASMYWMCVKLHSRSQETHAAIVDGASPGSWTDVLS